MTADRFGFSSAPPLGTADRFGFSSAPPNVSGRLTLVLVLAATTMLFAAFTAAALIRRTASDWAPLELPPLLWVNTAVLAAGSVAMERARRSGEAKIAKVWLVSTLGIGGAFLVGQALAWRELAASGVFLSTHPHSSFFYLLTAVHGAHIVAGLAWVGWLVARAGRAGSERLPTGLAAGYWHYMGGVWLYVLVLLQHL